MKKLLILPLLLAACAPAVQSDPAATTSRTYPARCPVVLDGLTSAALRTRLAGGSWQPLKAQNRTNNGVMLTSQSTGQISGALTVLATCSGEGEATLTLATSGPRSPYGEVLNDALLDGIVLP